MHLISIGIALVHFFLAEKCSAGFVSKNVTVSGVLYERSAVVPDVWGISVRRQALTGVSGVTGICPIGRYCPFGTSEPVVCSAGRFSVTQGLVANCPVKCQPSYYCPDPGKRIACPANTNSDWGKTSQADCKCNPGYQCVYKKQINLNVVVNVPYRVWVSSQGAELKAALLQAVAESAGVSAGSVRIEQVLPSVVPGVVAGSGGGGNRRLLGMGKEKAAMVRLSVHGADKVEGLQERLSQRAEFRGGARVHWKRVDNLRVLPKPPTSEKWWDVRLWRTKTE